MTRLQLRTPSRLHFGLLGWGPDAPRQFGGVGLMIEAPGLELAASPATAWGADGPLAARALGVASQVAGRLDAEGTPIAPIHLAIRSAPPEHVGLGVGTQLSLAVARLLLAMAGRPEPDAARLAGLTGRGLRSGIGLHGSLRGGLIVDGGRRAGDGIPPLLSRLEFPADWSILVLIPGRLTGLHGPEEARAFATLPPISDAVTDRLCRLVLLGLLPAVIERDLDGFGAALAELQGRVGACFAPAQGGVFAHPELASIAAGLRAEGLRGVGQSSWGPTLYGFHDADAPARRKLLRRLRDRFRLGPDALFWTAASPGGAVWG